MEMPVQCSRCGDLIELNDSHPSDYENPITGSQVECEPCHRKAEKDTEETGADTCACGTTLGVCSCGFPRCHRCDPVGTSEGDSCPAPAEERHVPDPEHLTLGDLVMRLNSVDRTKQLPVGFRNPHSYRGYYEDLGFELARDITVGEVLDAAESAVDAVFTAWKGGDYKMGRSTPVWLVAEEGRTGESLGAVLLELMLAQEADRG